LVIHFTADRGDARLRLDQMLVRRITQVSGMSRSRAQQWIAEGLVSVNRTPAGRSSMHVREGTAVEVALPVRSRVREHAMAEPVPLDILYEDETLMAVNKPAGMVVHPSFRNRSGTLLNGVLWKMRDRKDVRPGLVSRLDKDTSGVVVIALSPGAHARIQRDVRAGHVNKQYLAIVRGTPRPAEGRIAMRLRRDPADRRRVIVDPAGVPSETTYSVLANAAGHSLVSCELLTGRTHQIRVHFASSGWSIAGDLTYGQPDPFIARQALHAWRITLSHPRSRQRITVEAPLPDDICCAWRYPLQLFLPTPSVSSNT
jgi:23S rRNA pseudouridine1911/1915/1917 synthase